MIPMITGRPSKQPIATCSTYHLDNGTIHISQTFASDEALERQGFKRIACRLSSTLHPIAQEELHEIRKTLEDWEKNNTSAEK